MRRHSSRIAHLRSVAMFSTCSDKELMHVARLAEELPVAAGEVLVQEGRPGHEFYVIVSGRAEVTQAGRTIALLGPGEHFGELALLDPHTRTATVTMTEAGQVLEVSQREFWSLLNEVPALPLKMLQGLARREHSSQLVPA